jgi:hypothetical protein
MPSYDTSPSIEGQSDARYRLEATVLKVPLKLVPTVPMMATAATAISEAISPYSIAVTPLSSLSRREIRLSIHDLHYIIDGFQLVFYENLERIRDNR